MVVAALGPVRAAPAGARAPRRLALDSFRPAAVPGEYVVGLKRGTRDLGIAHIAALGARVVATTARRALLVRGASPAALQANESVAYVEPNYVRYLSQVFPNDPEFVNQWGLHNTGQPHRISGPPSPSPTPSPVAGTADADMDVPEAWATTQGDSETVVAILDSGVDTTHPDLTSSLWTNAAEATGLANVDDDGNGYIDDVHGWDFAEHDSRVFEPNPAYFGFDHGTHVAGTVAATANNGVGIAGVCPSCKVMVLKVFEPHDTDNDGVRDEMLGDIAAEVEAIEYAIAMGADVINGSLGAPLTWSRSERAAIRRAQAAGILSVFAAGNENGDNDLIGFEDFDGDGVPDSLSPSYPASYTLSGIIAVAASNHHDQNGVSTRCATRSAPEWPCTFTNWGATSVDVSAPGVDIISTVPGNRYDVFDGTSMAAPHVAGLAALVRSAHPTYGPIDVKNAIMNSVEVKPGLAILRFAPGITARGRFTVTGGRVNAAGALIAATADATPAHDGTIANAVRMRRSASGTVTWPEDVNDVFKKRLVKGADYRVRLDGPAGTDMDLVVYKPGTREIWQVEDGCLGGRGRCKMLEYPAQADADESVTFRARKTGTYYVQVAAYLLGEGRYTVKVTRI